LTVPDIMRLLPSLFQGERALFRSAS